MTNREQLLTALSEGRLTPEQVLAALSSERHDDTVAATPPMPACASVLLVPEWRPWRPDGVGAVGDASGGPVDPRHTCFVSCGSGEFLLDGHAAGRTRALITRKKRPERRFEDLAGQLLVWLQQTLETHPGERLRLVLIAEAEDVGVADGLAAMLRSVALEHPRLRMQLVSVAPDRRFDPDVLAGDDTNACFRVDDDGLRRLEWHPTTPVATSPRPWRDGATHLVTGGAGGLGAVFAREIAENAADARIVLVGRRPPTPEIERFLAVLQATGAEALYRPLDIARIADVRRLVQECDTPERPLRTVLHCAGVVHDRHLVNKTLAELQAVLRPKTDGLVALDEATAALPLDFFVAFSSLAATFGNAGQCDYAAANGFMDAFVAERAAAVARGERQGRSLSIDWPLWRDGGMRADPAVVAMTARSVGLAPIDNEAGIAAFHAALALDAPRVMVLHGDLERLSASPPAIADTTPAPPSAPIAPAADAGLLAERLLARLKIVFSKLTLVPIDRIDPHEHFDRYGVESVAVMALNAEFSTVFGPLPQTLLYDHPTLASLADHFCREHPDACRAWCGLASAPAPQKSDVAAQAPATTDDDEEPVLVSFRGRASRPAAPAVARSSDAALAAPATHAMSAAMPVAIIGIAGRYPGARDLDAFWAQLLAGHDAIVEIPDERWPADAFFHPGKGDEGSFGRYYCKWGGFIDGFAEFDPQFFGLSPREAYDSDPQERLFLQCCWATLEDAGYTVERLRQRHESSVGVFAGVTKTGFERYAPTLWAQGDPTKPSTSFASIANRVSYLLDLRGPSMPIDTMCSASLTAIHEACEHLARGECRLALAGGVNLYLHPSNYVELCAQGMLSPGGRCRSFGAGADGFVPGEGVGAVLLKPLADAEADGDRIHAVIRATAVNHGGRTNGYTVPSPKAQAALIRRTLDRAGIDARTVSCLEAHGTGTELGDPIEIDGLIQAFAANGPRETPCALGSLKSNIGHLESAAGIAGLTKLVLQLRHRTLVPTLHCDPPNPKVDWARAPVALQHTAAPWRSPDPATPLRAGLSSFGAGGANAHLIVEEYRAPAIGRPAEHGAAIVVLSARTPDRLRASAEALLAALPRFAPDALHAIAYTLQVGREPMAERLAIVAESLDALQARLRAYLAGEPDPDVFSGRAASGADPLVALSGDEEMAGLVEQWIARGRHAKALGLWVRGLRLDWDTLLPRRGLSPVSLPTYPFEPRRFWFDLRPVPPTAPAPHPLLVENASDLWQLRFRSRHADVAASLHAIDPAVEPGRWPAAALAEMAHAALRLATAAHWPDGVVLDALQWHEAANVAEVEIVLDPRDDDGVDVRIGGRDADGRDALLLTAIGHPRATDDEDGDAATGDTLVLDAVAARPALPTLSAITEVESAGRALRARFALVDDARASGLAPVLLREACALVAAASQGALAATPVEALQIEATGAMPLTGTLRLAPSDAEPGALDLAVSDDDGLCHLRVRGLRLADGQGTTALVGNLTLVPVWNPIGTDDQATLASSTDRVDAGLLVFDPLPDDAEVFARHWRDVRTATLDPEASVDAIAAHLAASGDPATVLWRVPAAASETDADAVFDDALVEAQRHHVRTGLRLLKALLSRGGADRALDLYVLTRDSQRVFPNRPIDPAHAGVHGLIAAAAKEYPQWRVRLVDLDADGATDAETLAAIAAMPADARGRPWARRDGRWFRPALLPTPSPASVASPYRDGGVYVVIGGAGHIGALWSEAVARRHGAHIVWIGRRAEDATIAARAAQAAAGGGTVEYVQADATDPASLRAAAERIRTRHGAIHGVVHAALIMQPRALADLDEAEFFEAMDTKSVVGLRIAQVFREDGLDFMLFFSSLIAIIKNAGQSHYAAGCCAADAHALALADHARDHGGPRVRTLDWGYWNKAENLESEGFQWLEQMGIAPIAPEDGLPAVDALLAGPHPQVGFMKTAKPLPVEGMSTQETVQRATARPPSPVPFDAVLDAVASGDAPRMLDDLPRGDAGLVERTEALERGLVALLGAELAAMAERERLDRIADLSAHIDPMYGRWLKASVAILDARGSTDVAALAAGRDAAWDDWARLCERIDGDEGSRARARLAEAALRVLPDLLTGRRLATDVLFRDASMDGVGGIYRGHTVADFFNETIADAVIACARRSDAPLRILEVGAGTGGTSGSIFAKVAATGVAVAEYVYTDISRAFLMHAEDTFRAQAPYLVGRLFDAEKSPVEQGIAIGVHDVVIATNVLHATRDIRRTLRNVKATLREGGLLLLNEMNTPSNLVTHLTFGLTKGWWLFEDDAVRVPGSPGLAPESWADVLACEGFSPVAFPAEQAHALGQQIVIARSDGVLRLPRLRRGRGDTPAKPRKATAPARAPAPQTAVAMPAPAAPRAPVRDPAALRDALEAQVRETVTDVLAKALRMARDEIAIDEPFADFGLDSIVGIGFVRELNAALGVRLETTVVFDYSTVARLVAHILAEHGAALAPPDAAIVAAAALPVAASTAPVPMRRPRTTVAEADVAHPDAVPAALPVLAQAAAFVREPIAVIGLAGRFAGSPDVEALWAHLAAGDDLVTPVTRWDLSAHYARSDGPGCRHGSFLDRIDLFDPMFFSISGLEASYMDPKQRIFLEECWKALETAGYAGEAVQGMRCGVYVGNEPGDYNQLFAGGAPGQAMWGVASSVLPARIAYFLDLQGPAISVDTACSSSLVAVHLACQALWGGEIELALAGGASVEATPGAYVGPGNAGMLSTRGRCHTFDARADGFVPGEGVGVLVLKRLSEAQAAGDHIHGVIRGSGLNQDGTTNGITAPSARSQERLECDVYERFGIDPGRITLVEAHGTGTELGDPIEFNALVRSFRRFTDRVGHCAIGSIKTNLGHAKAAAGVAGLMKILLAFRHRQIPPSLHFETVNPNIEFTGSPFVMATRAQRWEPGTDDAGRPIPRCAAISAFGMSGTNAHLVLEEAPAPRPRVVSRGPHLVVLSAMSDEQLRTSVQRLLAALDGDPGLDPQDIAHTLLLGRRHTDHRLATVIDDVPQLARRLRAWCDAGAAEGVHAGRVGGKRRREDPERRRRADACIDEARDAIDTSARRDALERLAAHFTQGERPDWRGLFPPGSARRVPLPTYPFAADSCWVPDPDSHPDGGNAAPVRQHVAALPSAIDSAPSRTLARASLDGDARNGFRAQFDGDEFFFADHVVDGRRILPGAAHLEFARVAWADAVGEDAPMRIRHAAWVRPLPPGAMEVRLSAQAGGAFRFELASGAGDARSVHSQGLLEPLPDAAPPPVDLDAVRAACRDEPLDRERYYALYAAMGVDYGLTHRAIERVFVGEDQALARLALPETARATVGGFGLHPALLDAAFQATSALWLNREDAGGLRPSLPFALDALEYRAPCPATLWAWIRRSGADVGSVRKLEIVLCDDGGRVLARLSGFSTRVLAATEAAVSLFRPLLRELAGTGSDPVATQARRTVLCGGFTADDVRGLAARLGDADVQALPDADIPALRFRRRAGALLERLREIVVAAPGVALALDVLIAGNDADEALALNAMLRTARLEQPRLATRLLVATTPMTAEAWAQRLATPLPAQADAAVIADGRLLRPVWEPLAAPGVAPNPWRSAGVYLITGGLGGLGLAFAHDIARHTDRATVVLAGRAAPGERADAALATLAGEGLRAVYRQVDIADAAAVATLVDDVRREFGRLDGVLHSAGVVADRLIVRKTAEDLARVFAPKVDGVEALDAAIGDAALDLFALFGSMSGAMGSVGQVDYAAANAYLAAFAARRNARAASGSRRGHCVAIDWPYWTEGGMRTDAAVQDDILRRHGLAGLSTEAGIAAFHAALASGESHVLVLAGVPAQLRAVVAGIGTLPAETPQAAAPAAARATATAVAAEPEADGDTPAAAIDFLRARVAEVLKLPAARIDAHAPMERYGIDSLMVMNLTNALETHFGSLSKTLFYEYQTIAELADHFWQAHRERLAALIEGESGEMGKKTTRDAADDVPPTPGMASDGVTHDAMDDGSATDVRLPEIAIVGLAARFPQAETPEAFWTNLVEGRDSIGPVPDWRWRNIADTSIGAKGRTRWGGFLDSAADFDPLFFGISPREAMVLDPQERIFLECAYAALEDAGWTRQALAADCTRGVGVYVGVMYEEYPYFAVQAQLAGHAVAVTGSAASIANRVSYYCGFDGPSIAVDSMCSSSLTTLHLACQALALGDCDAALAGGVNLSLHPNKYVLLEQGNFASSHGRCMSFGADGDGYVPSEGVGAVLLKTVARARRDGDRIHAVIRATGLNHGGKTNGYTVPNPNAQARLIRRVLEKARLTGADIDYVEAHGTGTSLGDPIEIAGLVKAFGDGLAPGSCAIGSVKSNIGHCESAAGVAAVCKVVLQMRHGVIAPSLHAERLNPNIDFASTPFRVVREPTPWPHRLNAQGEALPRVAGISSFGAGGANAHVILAEAPSPSRAAMAPRTHAFPLSARTEAQLRTRAQQLLDAIRTGRYEEADLASIAYTLVVGREAMTWRTGVIADSLAGLADALAAMLEGRGDAMPRSIDAPEQEAARAAFEASTDDAAALATRDPRHLLQRWWAGAPAPLDAAYRDAPPPRIGLPTYPFARQTFWFTPPAVVAVAGEEEPVTDAPATKAAAATPAAATSTPAPAPTPAPSAPPATARPARVRLDALASSAPAPAPARSPEAAPAPAPAIVPAPAAGTRGSETTSGEALRAALAASFAELLFMDVADVDARRSFGEMGMDSVLAVEWIRELNGRYGEGLLEATDLYDHADLRALARLLQDRLRERGAGTSQATAAATTHAAPRPIATPTAAATPLATTATPADGGEAVSADALRTALTESFAALLFMEVADVDARRSFGEMGMDSVLAVEWIRELNGRYGEGLLEATDLYDHADLRALTRLLQQRLQERASPAGTLSPLPAPAPAPAQSVRATPAAPAAAAVRVPEPEALRRALAESFAAILFMDPADVDPRKPLGEMGMDSVLAVEWVHELNRTYGIALDASDLYDHPDLRAVASLVAGRLAGGAPQPAPASAAPVAAAKSLSVDDILRRVRDGEIDVAEAERLMRGAG